MRGHARMIYSVLSNGKQPPGNGVIVMRSNIIMKCHFSPTPPRPLPPPLVCLKAAKLFPDPCQDGAGRARGGILNRNRPVLLPETRTPPNPPPEEKKTTQGFIDALPPLSHPLLSAKQAAPYISSLALGGPIWRRIRQALRAETNNAAIIRETAVLSRLASPLRTSETKHKLSTCP